MSFEVLDGILNINADAVTTTAMAAVMLLIGFFVKAKVGVLTKYCIPAPVVGGFIFMFVTFFGHMSGTFKFNFDTYFQAPFMLAFFTTVGLGASFTLLKKGGALLFVYWICSAIISVFQNIIGIGVGKVIGLEAPYALLASAISMCGGHGSAGSYGPTFVDMGYSAGVEVGAAASTFGLITAVMLGGPLAHRLIVKYDLHPDENDNFESDIDKINSSKGETLSSLDVIKNITAILICMAVGSQISSWVGGLIGMSFPNYVGAMFVAVIVRNLNEKFHLYNFNFSLVDSVGDVMLNLYLGIALMTLKMWELMNLIGGVLIVVLVQVLFMALAAYFVVFRILGKNYDAAVMCAGMCGHMLGATPSAIVNMTAVKDKYGMSRRSFMIVPIVGAFLVDLVYHPQTIFFIKLFVPDFAG